ncbi:MAG TPA: hypothetical protein PKD64_12380 [Pirellulaceae bacterium]|nr:hypothetical protein [Pirellulaceae bacterium]HMO92984.1 hypothetical protein [Pirellulaceae bacterium]HMP67937.1 hypothetical protein [Pirellulaceae bacterium]
MKRAFSLSRINRYFVTVMLFTFCGENIVCSQENLERPPIASPANSQGSSGKSSDNDEELPWVQPQTPQGQSASPQNLPANTPIANRQLHTGPNENLQLSQPRLAQPLDAQSIQSAQVRTAGIVPAQLIPTTPVQPPTQLIPPAHASVPAFVGDYTQEPQLYTQPANYNNFNNSANTLYQANAPNSLVIRNVYAGERIAAEENVMGNQNPNQSINGYNEFEQPTLDVGTSFGTNPSGVSPIAYENSIGSGIQDQNRSGEITRVTEGIDALPNTAGQVWREYDIAPYTRNITNSTRPQQAIIDWILLETGQDLWFNEPLGILNASKEKLRVYHTPQIQQKVKAIVDRLNQGAGRNEIFGMKLVTIANPTWRTVAYNRMQPITVQAPGVEGWLLSKENAAFLASELSRRNDYQLQSGGEMIVHDGQKYSLASRRPIQFYQSLRWVSSGNLVYAEPVLTNFEEGFTLELSTLSSLDGRTCEAVIKCDVDQIERLQRVNVNVPASNGQLQSLDLQIPQMVSWNVHERFRWPSDQVLLLSCGVVASPAQTGGLRDLSGLLSGSRRRADALLFLEYKGPAPTQGPAGFSPSASIPVNTQR